MAKIKIVYFENGKKVEVILPVKTRKDAAVLLGEDVARKSVASSSNTAIYIFLIGIVLGFYIGTSYGVWWGILEFVVIGLWFFYEIAEYEDRMVATYNNSSLL